MANNGMTTKKHVAIAALLSSRNVVEAAKLAKVGERSLWRWLREPAFQAALTEAEGAAIDEATRRLIGLQSDAINVLQDTLTDRKALPGIRMRAAQSILDFLMRLRELRNVESRLAKLEAIIHEHNQ